MKRIYGIGLVAVVAVAGSAVWIGCSDDDDNGGTTNTVDAGKDTGAVKDTGTPPVDTGTPPVDSGDKDTGPTVDAGTPSCTDYCTTIMTACTGGNAQYKSEADCKKVCPYLTVGTLADTTGNTLGCRAYRLGLAANDAGGNCLGAGPYGGGLCGTRCESFCDIAMPACPLDGGGPFAARSDCTTACAAYIYSDAGEIPGSGPGSGNTLNCREYHLQNAISTPVPHCGHIGPVPADAAAFPCK
jgi:hypothetical protein